MPDAILYKPGALTAEERALMARHPVIGAEIMDGIEAAAEAAGADLFLTKPFSPLELLRLVDRFGGGAR